MIFLLFLPSSKNISMIQLHLGNGFAGLYGKHNKPCSCNLCECTASQGHWYKGQANCQPKLLFTTYIPSPCIPFHPVLVKPHLSCKLLIIIGYLLLLLLLCRLLIIIRLLMHQLLHPQVEQALGYDAAPAAEEAQRCCPCEAGQCDASQKRSGMTSCI